MALHKGLERLWAFQLRGNLGGPKDAQAMGAKLIHDASGQWPPRALQPLAQSALAVPTGVAHWISSPGHIAQAWVQCCAGVAWGHINPLHLGDCASSKRACSRPPRLTNIFK